MCFDVTGVQPHGVTDAKWGDQELAEAEWIFILLEGTGNLVTKVLVEFFRSEAQSEQYPTQQMQGNFEFGVKALVGEEGVTMVAKCEVLLYANSERAGNRPSRPAGS